VPDGQISGALAVCLVQPPLQKYFDFSETQIRLHDLPSRPTEGRWPSSLTRGGMRWTRRRQARDVIAFSGNGVCGRMALFRFRWSFGGRVPSPPKA
jgi:hypothetical protein